MISCSDFWLNLLTETMEVFVCTGEYLCRSLGLDIQNTYREWELDKTKLKWQFKMQTASIDYCMNRG